MEMSTEQLRSEVVCLRLNAQMGILRSESSELAVWSQSVSGCKTSLTLPENLGTRSFEDKMSILYSKH